MTIEKVLGARSLWFVPLAELNPVGRNLDRWLGPLLEEWYGFAAPREEGATTIFAGGEFQPQANQAVIGVEFAISVDGAMAKAYTSTDHTDQFLGQVLERLAKEGLSYRPAMIRQRRYITDWIVRFREPLAPLAPLAGLYRLLGEMLYPNAPPSFDLFRMDFDADLLTPGKQPGLFTVQRIGAFADNRWLSSVPLPSDQHQRVLEELERALCASLRPRPKLVQSQQE
jgi:hypothetical protein